MKLKQLDRLVALIYLIAVVLLLVAGIYSHYKQPPGGITPIEDRRSMEDPEKQHTYKLQLHWEHDRIYYKLEEQKDYEHRSP